MLMYHHGASHTESYPRYVSRQESDSPQTVDCPWSEATEQEQSIHSACRYPDRVTRHERLQIISDRLNASLSLESASLPEGFVQLTCSVRLDLLASHWRSSTRSRFSYPYSQLPTQQHRRLAI